MVGDVNYALRRFKELPGFTATAVVTLALGICATTTMFSWIDATLVNPIPGVTRTADLVTVMRGTITEHPTPPFSYLDYVDLRHDARTLSDLLAYHDDFVTLTGVQESERVYGAVTSANYFDVLGVTPIRGRGFLPAEDTRPGGAPVVVISYAFWQTHFAADPSVIGRTLQINRHSYSIIGITPEGFAGCKTGLRDDLWIPLSMDRSVWGGDRLDQRGTFWLNVLGRLRPGVTEPQASEELNLTMLRIAASTPTIERGPNHITLDPLWRSPFGANVYLYKTLPMLFALATVLLILACANVANLQLVALFARRREIAVRLAMGAGRARIVRQLLTESVMTAVAGGALAWLLTTWTARSLASFVPATTPLTLNGQVNGRVLLMTFLVAMFAAIVTGFVPALRTVQLAPAEALKQEGGRLAGGIHRSRLVRALVVAQIALSLVLLVVAGLFTRTLVNEQHADAGFDPSGVLVATYDLAPTGDSSIEGTAFDRQLLARLRDVSGVTSAALADFSPLNFTVHSDDVAPDGYIPQPHESLEIDRAVVSPDFFRTLRTPVVSGREFADSDDATAQPVAIVNEAFGRRFWPGRTPIGRRVAIYGRAARPFTVVGVARDAKYRFLHYTTAPIIYLPLYQNYQPEVTLHLRVAGDPAALASTVRQTMGDLNRDLPLFNVTTLQQSIRVGSIFERLSAWLAGAFGLLALVLAGVGTFAAIAFSTRQRTHEIGIRIALGGHTTDVLKLVIGDGLQLALIGIAAGIVAALAVSRLVAGVLYGITPTDPLTYVTVAVILLVIAIAACGIPAVRAANLDPRVALGHD